MPPFLSIHSDWKWIIHLYYKKPCSLYQLISAALMSAVDCTVFMLLCIKVCSCCPHTCTVCSVCKSSHCLPAPVSTRQIPLGLLSGWIKFILIQGGRLVTRFTDSLPLLSVQLIRKDRQYCGRLYKNEKRHCWVFYFPRSVGFNKDCMLNLPLLVATVRSLLLYLVCIQFKSANCGPNKQIVDD